MLKNCDVSNVLLSYRYLWSNITSRFVDQVPGNSQTFSSHLCKQVCKLFALFAVSRFTEASVQIKNDDDVQDATGSVRVHSFVIAVCRSVVDGVFSMEGRAVNIYLYVPWSTEKWGW